VSGAHPSRHGVVFAFAGGSQTYALRLPEPERGGAAIRAGASTTRQYPDEQFDLREIGEEWVFGGWFRGEDDWCRAAYNFAGSV